MHLLHFPLLSFSFIAACLAATTAAAPYEASVPGKKCPEGEQRILDAKGQEVPCGMDSPTVLWSACRLVIAEVKTHSQTFSRAVPEARPRNRFSQMKILESSTGLFLSFSSCQKFVQSSD